MGIFDWKHWLIILIVVVLVFGTKRLKTLGSDFGEAIKGFRKAVNTEETDKPTDVNTTASAQTSASPASPAPSSVTPTPSVQKPHIIEGQAQNIETPPAHKN